MNETNKPKSIKSNFFFNALLSVSSVIFPFLSSMYVFRVIGPAGTGKVDFATSVVNYFAMFAKLGIPVYGIKVCAACRNDKVELSKTVKELFTINLFMSLLSYIVLIPSVFFIPKFSDVKLLIMLVSSTIVFNAIGIEYLYVGVEEYKYITIRSLFFKLVSFLGLFALVKTKDHYIIYCGITVFSSSASYILNFFHSRKIIDYSVKGPLNYKRHFKSIMVFFAMSCAVSVYLNLDRTMLGFLAKDEDVSFYSSGMKIKTILVTLISSLGNVILPRASFFVKNKQLDDFINISRKTVKFTALLSIPLVVYFIVFATESILVVSGEQYLGSVRPMQIIMPTLLFIGITGIVGMQMFVPLGKERYVLYSEIAGALVDLILNYLLIPKYQAVGAAIGTLVAEFAVLSVQAVGLIRVNKSIPLINSFMGVSYWKYMVGIVVALPCSIWLKFVRIPLFEGKILLHNLVLVAISGLCFFIPYLVTMVVLRDDFTLETLTFVKTKLSKRSSLRKNAL